MSYENRDHIQRGIDGYEAEIEDLQNKLREANQRFDLASSNVRMLRGECDALETKVRQLTDANRHREEQDNWRKVTGLRGF
jgi:uncharacterized coiled-coil DUF342 family protein